jgi:hypothetical protein
MTDRHAPVTNPDPKDETVRIYFSKLKLLVLAAVAITMSGAALYKIVLEKGAGNDPVADYGLIVLGLVIGGWMVMWALERRPALVIDEEGISGIRPETGLIPWRCVSALGMTKLAVVRAALMIGIDQEQASEAELKQWERRYASTFMNPGLARFQNQAGVGGRVIQMPISFMAISRKDLQNLLHEKVNYEGP